MKRYLLFGFDTYYPSGGVGDLLFDFDSVKEMDEKLEMYIESHWKHDCYNVLDTHKFIKIGGSSDKLKTLRNKVILNENN